MPTYSVWLVGGGDKGVGKSTEERGERAQEVGFPRLWQHCAIFCERKSTRRHKLLWKGLEPQITRHRIEEFISLPSPSEEKRNYIVGEYPFATTDC